MSDKPQKQGLLEQKLMVKHTQWDQVLHSLNRKVELVQEQIGLVNRLRDIELKSSEVLSVELEKEISTKSGELATKRKRGRPRRSEVISGVVGTAVVAGELPVKRKRGRPRRSEVASGVVESTVMTAETTETPVKRKRGRPAGSRSKVVSVEIGVSGEVGETPVKRKRGRPRKTDSVAAKSEGKSADLPTLLEVISQTVAKPMKQDEFVRKVRDAGYQTNSKDISNMVYQALLKLVKRGTMKKNAETREYSYAGYAA